MNKNSPTKPDRDKKASELLDEIISEMKAVQSDLSSLSFQAKQQKIRKVWMSAEFVLIGAGLFSLIIFVSLFVSNFVEAITPEGLKSNLPLILNLIVSVLTTLVVVASSKAISLLRNQKTKGTVQDLRDKEAGLYKRIVNNTRMLIDIKPNGESPPANH